MIALILPGVFLFGMVSPFFGLVLTYDQLVVGGIFLGFVMRWAWPKLFGYVRRFLDTKFVDRIVRRKRKEAERGKTDWEKEEERREALAKTWDLGKLMTLVTDSQQGYIETAWSWMNFYLNMSLSSLILFVLNVGWYLKGVIAAASNSSPESVAKALVGVSSPLPVGLQLNSVLMALLLLGLAYGTYTPSVWFYRLYVSRLRNAAWDYRDKLSRKIKQGIVGNVVSAESGGPIHEAEVVTSVGGNRLSVQTDSFGDYGLQLDAGNYTIKVSGRGYNDDSFAVALTADKPLLVVDRSLTPLKGKADAP